MIDQTLWHFTKPSEILPKPLGFSEFSSKSVRFCLKIRCSHVLFFQISHEKLPAVMHMIGKKKRKFCQNYTLLWAKKVNRMPFFPISDEKITALMSIFCQKRLFSKNKTSTLLKTKCSRVIFSFFFIKTPYSYAHIWSKNVYSVKTTLSYGP